MNPTLIPVGAGICARAAIARLGRCGLFLVAGACGLSVSGLGQIASSPVSRIGVNAAETAGPRIEFASPVFDFGRVKQGEVVRLDFAFKNSGRAAVEISDVQPGCGCTTALQWDRRVEPGQTGVISLQFNSAGFSSTVHKSATVTCNDPRQPTVTLQIQGDVWTPFAVTPASATFTVSTETEMSETRVVRIVNRLEDPIALSGLKVTSSTFRAELHPVKPGKEFELKIATVPPFTSDSASATITLKTSSSEAPTIVVRAQLIVQQPVVAIPERIALQAGPLAAATNVVVTIRNNGKHALLLSDANINVPGGAVTVQEIQKAELFQLTVKLPAGFEAKPEENVEVVVRSNHPKFATIRVPVVAPPRIVSTAKPSA
jgi:hypothetical protein